MNNTISNDSNLIKLLKCPICNQFFNEPIECLICHNNFCKECLDNFNSKNNNNNHCYFNCKDAKFIHNRFLKGVVPELKNFDLNNINNVVKNLEIHIENNILNPEYKKYIVEFKKNIKKERIKFNEEAMDSEKYKTKLFGLQNDKNKLNDELNNLKKSLILIEQFNKIEKLKKLIKKEKNIYEIYKLKLKDYEETINEEYEDEFDEY